jgi:ABC-type transporter Mla maintaining outer membrane lipid asymmetry ATPase subunit MlaF
VERTTERIIMLIYGKCHLTGSYSELSRSKDPVVMPFFQ